MAAVMRVTRISEGTIQDTNDRGTYESD